MQAELGVNVTELLRDSQHDGSPARKAYGSFVAPRRRSEVVGARESVEEAAKRHAHQILFLHRQHAAMVADFLRSRDSAQAAAGPTHGLVLVLDNLRSLYNVGSILRTAETAGVREVVTCGITPHPPHAGLRKTAFSAHDEVRTRQVGSCAAAVRELQAEGLRVYAMETTQRSLSYTQVAFPEPCALVLGNEVTGVDTEVLAACDAIVEIPTFGKKNSLNVAAACPVVVFEVLRQWGKLSRSPPP